MQQIQAHAWDFQLQIVYFWVCSIVLTCYAWLGVELDWAHSGRSAKQLIYQLSFIILSFICAHIWARRDKMLNGSKLQETGLRLVWLIQTDPRNSWSTMFHSYSCPECPVSIRAHIWARQDILGWSKLQDHQGLRARLGIQADPRNSWCFIHKPCLLRAFISASMYGKTC